MVGALLTFFAPGTLQHIMQGKLGNIQITSLFLYILTFTSTAPIVMAYLVLVIKNKTVNKWLSLAMSIFIATMGWIDFFGQLGFMGIMGAVMVIWANIFSTMLIWYSWKWPM